MSNKVLRGSRGKTLEVEKSERLGIGVAVRQSDWYQTRFLG
jgi:hypothetical protein